MYEETLVCLKLNLTQLIDWVHFVIYEAVNNDTTSYSNIVKFHSIEQGEKINLLQFKNLDCYLHLLPVGTKMTLQVITYKQELVEEYQVLKVGEDKYRVVEEL